VTLDPRDPSVNVRIPEHVGTRVPSPMYLELQRLQRETGESLSAVLRRVLEAGLRALRTEGRRGTTMPVEQLVGGAAKR
jgi:hypothetical protein